MRTSGKVYGYRKLHDDLLDHSETCCPNRVARLTRIAGIKAQIGYKRRPGIYGGRPSTVIDNALDLQFDVAAPDKAWVTEITYSAPRHWCRVLISAEKSVETPGHFSVEINSPLDAACKLTPPINDEVK